MRPLKIGILAPLKRRIAADTTSSRPHLIYELIVRLYKRGHQITIFGTGDSEVPGIKVIPSLKTSLTTYPPVENSFYLHTSGIANMMKDVLEHESELDLIHNHLYPEFFPLFLLEKIKTPMLTTVHAQMTEELSAILRRFPDAHLVAISEAHKRLSKGLNMSVVLNGISIEEYTFNPTPSGNYLLFLGRISSAKDNKGNYLDPKGVLTAISVAKKSGEELFISGNVEDRKFYDDLIKPHLTEKIKFIGEVSPELPLPRAEVVKLMQNAKALLMPINWEEPFGLVMAEANACGTPVIAFKRGAVPEIVQNTVNGFIVDSEEEMIEKIGQVKTLDRMSCRRLVEDKFSLERMVDDYEKLYESLV